MDANPVNIYEYEAIAMGKLGQGEYDFIAGAATDEITLRRTRAVFDAIMLRPSKRCPRMAFAVIFWRTAISTPTSIHGSGP